MSLWKAIYWPGTPVLEVYGRNKCLLVKALRFGVASITLINIPCFWFLNHFPAPYFWSPEVSDPNPVFTLYIPRVSFIPVASFPIFMPIKSKFTSLQLGIFWVPEPKSSGLINIFIWSLIPQTQKYTKLTTLSFPNLISFWNLNFCKQYHHPNNFSDGNLEAALDVNLILHLLHPVSPQIILNQFTKYLRSASFCLISLFQGNDNKDGEKERF